MTRNSHRNGCTRPAVKPKDVTNFTRQDSVRCTTIFDVFTDVRFSMMDGFLASFASHGTHFITILTAYYARISPDGNGVTTPILPTLNGFREGTTVQEKERVTNIFSITTFSFNFR